jgi:hypothetical protein
MTNAEILAEIDRLEAELLDVHGKECERYTRCVGYFRPIKDMNAGKQAEIADRVPFEVDK